MSKTIIFVPGFKGSSLFNAHQQLIWPNFWRAQMDVKTNLAMSLPELGIVNDEIFYAKSIVLDVNLIPGVYRYSIYGPFVRFLQETYPRARILYYPYDWRQDLSILGEALFQYVERSVPDVNEELVFIGHSMGGLIISDMLRRIKHPVKQVFYVATPFLGSLKALLYLMRGNPFGLNKTLLSSRVMATFPSIYYLLPRYRNALQDASLSSIEVWREHVLGFLMQEDPTKGVQFLQKMFNMVESFYQSLALLAKYHPKTVYFFINNTTLSTPMMLRLGQSMQIEYGLGDGTVPDCSLAKPAYFQAVETVHHTMNKVHTLSFTDKNLFEHMKYFL